MNPVSNTVETESHTRSHRSRIDNLVLPNTLNRDAPKRRRAGDVRTSTVPPLLGPLAAYKAHRLAVPVFCEVEGDAAGQREVQVGEGDEVVAEVGGDDVLRPEGDSLPVLRRAEKVAAFVRGGEAEGAFGRTALGLKAHLGRIVASGLFRGERWGGTRMVATAVPPL